MTKLGKLKKKDIRTAKKKYEVRIARDAENDPKGFYQLYKVKAKERIGPLEGMDGSLRKLVRN